MDSKLNATHNTAHRIALHLLEAGRLSLRAEPGRLSLRAEPGGLSLRAEPGGLSLMPLVLLAEEA